MRGPALEGRETPCHHCQDRYIACSDHCKKPEFLKWKREHAAMKEAERREKANWSYTAEMVRKNRRRK